MIEAGSIKFGLILNKKRDKRFCSMFLWIEKCKGRLKVKVSESGMVIERNRGGFDNFDF